MLGADGPSGVLVQMKLEQEYDQFQWGWSLPASRLGSGWSLKGLGRADATGLVGQRAVDKDGLLRNFLTFVFVKCRDNRLVRWWWEGVWYSVTLA